MIFYDSKIVLFGGYGEPSDYIYIQTGAKFDKSRYGNSGYTNELHSFSLKEGERLHIDMSFYAVLVFWCCSESL